MQTICTSVAFSPSTLTTSRLTACARLSTTSTLTIRGSVCHRMTFLPGSYADACLSVDDRSCHRLPSGRGLWSVRPRDCCRHLAEGGEQQQPVPWSCMAGRDRLSRLVQLEDPGVRVVLQVSNSYSAHHATTASGTTSSSSSTTRTLAWTLMVPGST